MAEPSPGRLREHDVTLAGGNVTLRPLTEHDWETLLRWNNDPEVLYFAEGDNVTGRSAEQLQAIYRPISQHAFCFVIERNGTPVGDCWLQQLNLDRILEREAGLDCRRIDIVIDRGAWGQRAGAAAVHLLLDFAFTAEGADAVFACDVADYNERSLRLWRALGFELYGEAEQPPGSKARIVSDFVLRIQEYLRAR